MIPGWGIRIPHARSHGAQGHTSQLEKASQRAELGTAEGGKEGNGGREGGLQDGRTMRKKEASLQGGCTYSLRGATSKLPATGVENKNYTLRGLRT